jgi:hypothetical protein
MAQKTSLRHRLVSSTVWSTIRGRDKRSKHIVDMNQSDGRDRFSRRHVSGIHKHVAGFKSPGGPQRDALHGQSKDAYAFCAVAEEIPKPLRIGIAETERIRSIWHH